MRFTTGDGRAVDVVRRGKLSVAELRRGRDLMWARLRAEGYSAVEIAEVFSTTDRHVRRRLMALPRPAQYRAVAP